MGPVTELGWSHTFIDLSHVVENGLITYKGLPAPLICDYLSREESRSHYSGGTEFQIGKIEMVANTGTYLDSPFHRYADGKDLSELELATVAGLEGRVIRPPDATGVRSPPRTSPASTLAARRCWCTPDGLGTGRPTHTSKGIRFLTGRCGDSSGRGGRGSGRHRLVQHRRHR